MAEVLGTIDDPIVSEGRRYHARVVGRLAGDGMWEGWFEFDPLDSAGDTVVGPVESRQPEREHLQYWASGLSAVFAEGALRRALSPLTVHVRVTETPRSQAPARRMVTMPAYAGPEPVLDPFEIGGRNLDILRQELRALNRPRLQNIIAAYDLNPTNEDLSWMSDLQLVAFIVTAVEARLLEGTR